MAIYTETNTAKAEKGTLNVSASVEFQAASEIGIDIIKTVDRPGDLYYHGDPITFKISIKRSTGINRAINQITLKDTFPSIVSFKATDVYRIEGTGGNISVIWPNLLITELVLNDGNPVNTIEVRGIIDLP